MAKKWNIDNAHSEIGFKVRHLMISTVRGKFNSFEGEMYMPEDDDFAKAAISFSAQTASINTSNEARDKHLQSADFFDTEKFPMLTFKSKNIVENSTGEFTVIGDFTMHGETKEIKLSAVLNGITTGMDGVKVMSFDISGSLNRKDFGLVWNAPIEKGGVAVSEEVKFDIITEFKEEKES